MTVAGSVWRRLPVALLLWLVAVSAAATVDPFYLSRLQEGIAAAERGAHAEAAKSLRLACFGMLDEEPQLADCLVRLALEQAKSNDRDGFAQSFRRLVEGEELVGLYTKAGLPPALTVPFEEKVLEWIPRAALATAAGFQRLAVDQRETQLAGLPAKTRLERLAKLEKEEPKSPRWPLLVARIERQEGEARAAMAAADRALRIDDNLVEARCLRGWARAELGRFADAADDLAGCAASDPAFAVAELRSRVELAQWTEAESLLATLPEAQRRQPAVAALAKRIERGTPRRQGPDAAAAPVSSPAQRSPATAASMTGSEPPAAAAGAGRDGVRARPGRAGTPPPGAGGNAGTDHGGRGSAATPPADPPVAGGPPGGALPPGDETLLARAQAQLAAARTAADIEQAYTFVSALAARYPTHRRVQHTAAEIAYRASRWSDAVRHFRQGGDPGEAQPLLLFYFAVSLWESGAHQEAAALMRRCEGKLSPTPFVQAYRDKILGPAPRP